MNQITGLIGRQVSRNAFVTSPANYGVPALAGGNGGLHGVAVPEVQVTALLVPRQSHITPRVRVGAEDVPGQLAGVRDLGVLLVGGFQRSRPLQFRDSVRPRRNGLPAGHYGEVLPSP